MPLSNCTPHIGARKNQIAKRVLMPGDPQRAKWIAQTYLKGAKLVTDIRGMLGYTGKYKNVPVTVMAHGMGIPSACIYVHELYTFYNVGVIYRIGTCGVGRKSGCYLGDVIIETEAWSDIPIKPWLKVNYDKKNIFKPSKSSVAIIKKMAKKMDLRVLEKRAVCSTFFYDDYPLKKVVDLTGTNILEMEGFGIFCEAKRCKKKAACLLTVSDNIDSGEEMSPKARATTLTEMAELALESIIKERV